MRKIFSFLLIASCITPCFSGVIELRGNYKGENLYIQNPFAGTGQGFCATKVLVNGKETDDEINSAAFEINLKKYNFQLGDTINIKIFHKDDCKPKVLNPCIDCIDPDELTFISIKIDSSGTLIWKTKNENLKLLFSIQQYRWNKWIKVGEIEGKGGTDEHEYRFKVTPHSGENQFRIKRDYLKYPNYSKPVKWNPKVPEIKVLDSYSGSGIIQFSTETMYELYDKEGNVVLKGYGKKVECSKLPYDVYYLNYDNHTTEIVLRQPKENNNKK